MTLEFSKPNRRSEKQRSFESLKPILQGIPASPGIAKGAARIVRGADDESKFKDQEILVTRITDPTMVSMMNRALAVVCDIGGITSHPSILSRELGIPCVVGTKDATKVLKDGQKIKVDGTYGKIYLDK